MFIFSPIITGTSNRDEQGRSRRLHFDRGYTTPTTSIWRVSCVQSSRAAVDGHILTEVTLHLPSLWRVSCVQSSRTVVDGYILTEVTLHLHLLYDVWPKVTRTVVDGYILTEVSYTFSMTGDMCTVTRTAVDGNILTEVTLHLHLLYDVCHVNNHPVPQQTVTFWQRLHYTYTFSMTCVMCTIIQYLSRWLHSDRGCTTRGFSALSAPLENGGIPKANGPVPNRILITYFPIQKKKIKIVKSKHNLYRKSD